MTHDFYCEEVLSGKTPVRVVAETERVLAFHHTRPFTERHIVLIPKSHIDSLLTLDVSDGDLLTDMLGLLQQIAAQVTAEYGACRVVTNLGDYQESKHLHWHITAGERLR